MSGYEEDPNGVKAINAAMFVMQTAREQLQKAEARGFIRAVRSLRRAYQKGLNQKEEYPSVPLPAVTIRKTSFGKFRNERTMPNKPGVYFIWSNDKVVYVGTSRVLSTRVFGSHEHAHDGDLCSWLVFLDDTQRVCAESHYIGLLQPERNVAGMLSMWGQ